MKIKHTILNALGLNKWEYFNLREPYGAWEYEYAFHEYRICKITGKFQEASPHCFGLKPPAHKMFWRTLDRKPKLRLVGDTWKVS